MRYICDNCKKNWDYPVEICIFCGKTIRRIDEGPYIVQGLTQVFIPSEDHPIIPYYIAFLKDSKGNCRFLKTIDAYSIGDIVDYKENNNQHYCVGIIGTGVTAIGIAVVALAQGNRVILKSRSEASLTSAKDSILKSLSKKIELDKIGDLLSKAEFTLDYNNLLDSDIIIESVVEDFEIKRQIFKTIDSICNREIILASNTSSLSISEIGKDLIHPERIIGFHFFNPIVKMKLVEVIKTDRTDARIVNKSVLIANSLGKIPLVMNDSPGFIVNRLLFSMINEACCMLEKGTATLEDIDKAMKLGANFPMGPFELADLIGLDICYEIINNFNKSINGNQFEPSQKLINLLKEGHYGRKTGKGFYNYK